MVSEMVCTGCGEVLPAQEILTFTCPNAAGEAAGDIDHVLRLRIDPTATASAWPGRSLKADDNPLVRYRRLAHSYQLALAHGMSDDAYLQIVNELTLAIENVADAPLRVTPLSHVPELGTFVKNETVNISGSHKARHLIGTALHLEIAARSGNAETATQVLAIASCGNAALAAAVVARAAKRKLRVFLPPWADAGVVDKLKQLDAEQVICERRAGDAPGDPCYLRFREAVLDGALPFTCQGGDNALAILGGHTLGWELIDQSQGFDHIFIQVGGGALASSTMQAYALARDAGIIHALPRFHVVQTDNAHPLARAWQKLQQSNAPLSDAAQHRSEYMWPWESEPKSIASGILDDETYDWFSIATGLRQSGGSVVTVSEDRLIQAQALGQTQSGIQVDATGTAGLAGLLEMRSRGEISKDDTCAVLFTGAIR
jgi:threonine synthase